MSEPIHIISLGAGVQSSTMALMAAHGEITPMPKCAIFADTQDEPQSVYKWLDWIEKQLPFPVHRVTRGRLSVDHLLIKTSLKSGKRYMKTLIPAFVKQPDGKIGLLGRSCTVDYKIDVVLKKIKEVAGITRTQTTLSVIQWIGISRDEAHRMKPSRHKCIEHRWPLVDQNITRRKCLEWMKLNEFPEPPRSACVFCPFHSDAEWRRIRDHDPESFKASVQFERDLQLAASNQEALTGVPFLTRKCVPLDQVDFSTDEDHGQQVMFGNECEGMCGV